MKWSKTLIATALALACVSVYADITVGVTVSATGPAASLGIPEKNTIELMPKLIGGQKVNYIRGLARAALDRARAAALTEGVSLKPLIFSNSRMLGLPCFRVKLGKSLS